MQRFEYKVIPAPTRGQKAPGIKTPEGRFANALDIAINDLASDGWEYLRADTLPSEERQGLTGSATHFRNVLVFRRALGPLVAAPTDPRTDPTATAPAAAIDPTPDPEPNARAVSEKEAPDKSVEAADESGPFSDLAHDEDPDETTRPPQA